MDTNILVLLDGTTTAEKVLPHVEEMSMSYPQTQVILCRIVEPATVPFVAFFDESNKETQPQVIEAKNYLSGWQQKLIAKGIAVKTFVESGVGLEVIQNLVEREEVDMIAIAGNGHAGLLLNLLLQDTSQYYDLGISLLTT